MSPTHICITTSEPSVRPPTYSGFAADDYLTKPFGAGECLARVRAASRRRGRKEAPPSIFEFGDISVDMTTRTVKKGGVCAGMWRTSGKNWKRKRLVLNIF